MGALTGGARDGAVWPDGDDDVRRRCDRPAVLSSVPCAKAIGRDKGRKGCGRVCGVARGRAPSRRQFYTGCLCDPLSALAQRMCVLYRK